MPRTGDARGASLLDQLVEPTLADPLHRPREGADAGQDDAVGVTGPVGVGGDPGRGADVLERLLDRPQVSHPVVEDRDPGHRLSLTEGPLGRGHAASRRGRSRRRPGGRGRRP